MPKTGLDAQHHESPSINNGNAVNGPSITFSNQVEHNHKAKRIRNSHIEILNQPDYSAEDIEYVEISNSHDGNGAQTEDPNVWQFIDGVFLQDDEVTVQSNSNETPPGPSSNPLNDRARQPDKKKRRKQKPSSPTRVALAPVPLHSNRQLFKKVIRKESPNGSQKNKDSQENITNSPSDDKRGPYNCGKCGKPKKGHDCSIIETYLYMQIPSQTLQPENSPLPQARNSSPFERSTTPQLKFKTVSQYNTRSISSSESPTQPVSPNPKIHNTELSLRKSPRRSNS